MIILDRPPNFEFIRDVFPLATSPGVLFAYYPNIHNPSGIVVPPALMAHEEVHLNRQRDAGPTIWWESYLSDCEFRYHEELLAHAAEFLMLQTVRDRNFGARLLLATALRLVAPLYNYQPPRTLQQALKDLQREIHNAKRS